MGEPEYSDGVRAMAAHALLLVGKTAIPNLHRAELYRELQHLCNKLAKAPGYRATDPVSATILANNRAYIIAQDATENSFVDVLNRLPVRPIYHEEWSSYNPMLPKGLMVSFRRSLSTVVVPLDRDTYYRSRGSVEPGYNVLAQAAWCKNVQLVGGSACPNIQALGKGVNKGRKLGPGVGIDSKRLNIQELPKPKPLWDSALVDYVQEKIQERRESPYLRNQTILISQLATARVLPPRHPNSPCYTVESEDAELTIGGREVNVPKITFEPEPLSYANGKFLRSLMVKAAKVAGGANDTLSVALYASREDSSAESARDYTPSVMSIIEELSEMFRASRYGGPHRPRELVETQLRILLSLRRKGYDELKAILEGRIAECVNLADKNLSAIEEYARCIDIRSGIHLSAVAKNCKADEVTYKLSQQLMARYEGDKPRSEDTTGEAHLAALREWHKFRA
jgi:hypothetical protein